MSRHGTAILLSSVVLFEAIFTVPALPTGANFLWAKDMGGTDYDVAQDVVLDTDGNVYTTGGFSSSADFDPGPHIFNLTSAGSADVFISKIDSTGNFVWAKAVEGPGDDGGTQIITDSTGNVYTTGIFRDTADFDPGTGIFNLTSVGSRDIFVVKLDKDGNFIWAKAVGGTGDDLGYAMALDTLGSNIYLAGGFSGIVDFDPNSGVFNLTTAGDYDVFLSKMDNAGNFVFAKSMGGMGPDFGIAIRLDTAETIYVTGSFSGIADFDPAAAYNLTSAGSYDVFVTKLNSAGRFVWAKQMGGSEFEQPNDLVLDGHGNVLTAGLFYGTADFDPSASTFELSSAGNADIFISKLDRDGKYMWAKQMGGSGYDIATGIALSAIGEIYTTGHFSSSADFDPGSGIFALSSAGGLDIVVSKLDGAGDFAWAGAMGGVGYDESNGIVVDRADNIYTTGGFYTAVPSPGGPSDFDPGPGTFYLSSVGLYDVFISKLGDTLPIAPTTTSVYRLPDTGFGRNVVTVLPPQPADRAYGKLSDLWLEIPSQSIKSNIVGVPQWDCLPHLAW